MKHLSTQPLHTKRLHLRRFTLNDVQAMFDNWASDEQVSRYVTWEKHPSPEATRKVVEEWVNQYDGEDCYNWIVEYEGVPVGNIHAYQMYPQYESAEVGYCFGSRWWGKGIASEALEAATAFLFGEAELHRIALCHAKENPASGRVMQKCGYRLEGIFRESRKLHNDAYTDVLYYAMLRGEWESRRCKK